MLVTDVTQSAVEAQDVGRNKPVLSEAERPAPAGVSGELSRLVRMKLLPETPASGLIPAYGAKRKHFS